jgi:hypothetical protein
MSETQSYQRAVAVVTAVRAGNLEVVDALIYHAKTLEFGLEGLVLSLAVLAEAGLAWASQQTGRSVEELLDDYEPEGLAAADDLEALLADGGEDEV